MDKGHDLHETLHVPVLNELAIGWMEKMLGITVIRREERNPDEGEAEEGAHQNVEDVTDHAIEEDVPNDIRGFAPLLQRRGVLLFVILIHGYNCNDVWP